MSDVLVAALALYIRLVSYPAAIIGVIWLMLFRPDWKHRTSSLFYLSQAVLLTAQFATVVMCAINGENYIAWASDVFITPALLIFNFGLWSSILWLSRRWRHDPHLWI